MSSREGLGGFGTTPLPHCLPNMCPELRPYSARPGDHSACTWAGSPPPATRHPPRFKARVPVPGPRLPVPRWPRPTLLSDPLLGQLVLASGRGMGWLGSTRQGLFTMADDLEQQ